MPQAATALNVLTSLAGGRAPDTDYTEAYDALIRGGDCSLDAFQGVYWAARNRRLVESPTALQVRLHCPVIVVGSGPSLDRALGRLKALNGKLPIFAAESAVRILLQHDILPDFVCPMERTNINVNFMKGAEGAIYAGTLFSPWAHQFQRAIVCANNGWINAWMGLGPLCASAATSGGTAVLTAATISDKEVFLVGIDNCAAEHSHCADYRSEDRREDYDCEVPCYDGINRPALDVWRQMTDAIGYSLSRRGGVFQTDRSTACIAGIPLGGLPEPDRLPVYDQTAHMLSPVLRTVENFNDSARTLRDDFERALARARTWSTPDDIDSAAMVDTPNRWAIGYVMSTVTRQMTIEKMLGRGDLVCGWFAQAMENILDNLWNLLGEIQDAS